MWKIYDLTMRFQDKLMGGVPKHPDVIRSWLDARKATDAAFAKMVDPVPLAALAEEVEANVEAEAIEINKLWTGFMGDDGRGLYVPGFHVKAHLKNNASIMKETLGIKALKAKVADRVFVVEDKLYLGFDQPSGYWEHPVHVMTMQGARSALKRNDYVEKPTINCSLKVLDDGVVSEKTLAALLEYGAMHGFGAERGLGNGRYEFTLKARNGVG